ncbi:MAG: hypothetical protein NT039_00305 [Candidatus Berkelbacteria bacterium]|nr:hypothetical protein [Candidatus Berkelbacteria bacterium]
MKEFNLEKSIEEVFKTLREKERDILGNRFGLFGEKAKTLALIGKNLKLTRERIRQIQNSALFKIKNSQIQNERIFAFVHKLSSNQGGLISVKDVEEKLETNSNYALFLLEATKNLKKIKGYKNLNSTFIDKELEQKDIISAEIDLAKIFKSKGKAITVENLIEVFKAKSKVKLSDETVKSLIYSSLAFAFDWKGRVGLSIWREINPKSARDKSHFILKKEERPLHFTHIAELITKENFAGKNPTAATVHNELILDPRFVLVGRGIYALAEWGFKGGTVEDVIAEILRSNPKGLVRDVIIEEVLKTKLVARNTVMMNLLVKKQFERDQKGLYKLAKS